MITFNELDIVEELLKNTDDSTITMANLKLVAKYLDYTNSDIKEGLKEFVTTRCHGIYNEPLYDKYICECFKYCKTFKIMSCNYLPLTKKEYETISNIKKDKERRIMFILLMYAKNKQINSVYKENKDENNNEKEESNNLFVKISAKDLFKLANIRYVEQDSVKAIRYLTKQKLIKWRFGDIFEILIYDINDNDYYDNLYPTDSMVNYIIGIEEKYKSFKCSECGEWKYVLKKNYKTKLCDKCSKENVKNQTRNRVREYRKRQNKDKK